MDDDTIAALSTPPGKGGIAVIRISGSLAKIILQQVSEQVTLAPKPRRLYHGYLVASRKRIAECLAVYFPAPRSYTGEEVVEISLPSNPFLIEEALHLILQQGARMALPGEFTFRAYKNGKIDLLQAEALNSLIQANSKYQAQMAFHNLEGKLSQEVQAVRQCLLELSAQVETVIDFQEDQQLDPFPRQDQLDKAIVRLDAILSKNRFNEALAQGLNVVIAGKVNTGKSTLFNALLMEERAIISAVPGTTRDYLTEKIYIAGYPVEVTDMAGIQQQTGNDIEGQGIQRSLHKIEQSDAVLFVVDGTQALDQSDFEIFNLIVSKNKLIVINKTDIATPSQVEAIAGLFSTENVCAVSAKERIHIDQILVFLKTLLETYHEQSADLAINLRQKTLLERLRQSMQQIAAMLPSRWPQIEMTAEEIRQALSLIGELSGEVTRNDVLKEIFKTFCIGK